MNTTNKSDSARETARERESERKRERERVEQHATGRVGSTSLA